MGDSFRSDSNGIMYLFPIWSALVVGFLSTAICDGTDTSPVIFACTRRTNIDGIALMLGHSGVIEYSDCNVDTTNGQMDKGTGVFRASQIGIYQFSFTAWVRGNLGIMRTGDKYGANDLLLGLEPANNNGDNIGATVSTTVTVSMEEGDEVFAKLLDGQFNRLFSSEDRPTTHFTGVKLA